MTTSAFLRGLEDTLELESGSIVGNETLSTLEWWDSLAALTVMSVADQELHVNISGAQLANCKTVSDILGLLADKLTS